MLRRRSENAASRREEIAALYETHYERVARYIAVRIGNPTEAEDLASEVFVRALRAADRYTDTGAPMSAWLYRIAHNLVIDLYRKRGRSPGAVPLDAVASLQGGEDPTDRVERAQDAERLGMAMNGLSQGQRQVLALRFGAQMSSQEAAEAMGKKPGAVREMQSAAIKRLRELLS